MKTIVKSLSFRNLFLFSLSIISCLYIVTIFFTLRWIWWYQVDPQYLADYYAFSQWAIPLSSLTMGDSDLYLHSGVQLVQSFEPYRLNPEVPVLVKWLFGWFILTTGNPLWVSVIAMLVVLITTDQLSRKILRFSIWQRWLLLLVMSTSPLLLSQVTSPLLDLPQVAFYVVHVWFLFQSRTNQSSWKTSGSVSIAALALGAMAATKFPLYVPIILLIDSWYLWNYKQSKNIPLLFVVTVLGYIATYTPFILHNGIVIFLKGQKWIIEFYRSSDVQTTPGMAIITAFTGWYQGWWGAGWERIIWWDPSWGLGLIVAIATLYSWFHHKTVLSLEKQYLLFIVVSITAMMTFIPFWPRYFIFIFPFLWLLIIDTLKSTYWHSLFLLFPLLGISILWRQSWEIPIQPVLQSWEQAASANLYQYFDTDKQQDVPLSDFVQQQQNHLRSVHAYEIQLDTPILQENTWFTRTMLVPVTLIGPQETLQQNYRLQWRRIHGQWKMSDFTLINTTRTPSLIPWKDPVLCVLPSAVDNWDTVYSQTAQIMGIEKYDAYRLIMRFTPQNYCIPVGIISDVQVFNSASASAALQLIQ